MNRVDWGSVPDWLAAVGSVVALFFIYFGARREIRSRVADEVSATARQARLISSWAVTRGAVQVAVRVTNESDGPVFDLDIAPLQGIDGDEPESGPAVLGVSALRGPTHRLDARRSAELFLTLAEPLVSGAEEPIVVALVFTDQNGLRWRRRGAGQPERM